jgi:hypothetical protein
MTVMAEKERVERTFEHVEQLESVAARLPRDEGLVLESAVTFLLYSMYPVRASVAAGLLSVDTKTVRAWVQARILQQVTAESSTVLRVDPIRLHEVWHYVREIREAGKNRGLLDEIARRMADEELLRHPDVLEGLEQMRRGEGTVVVPHPDDFESSLEPGTVATPNDRPSHCR